MELPLFHGEIVSSKRILYTPSEFARTSLIYLQETGELKAQHPHESRRSGLSSYLFFTVVSGAGELEYDGAIRPLKAGDCVFIDCSRKYCHRTSDDLWALKWVHFSGRTMPDIYAKYLGRGGDAVFPVADRERLDTLLSSIIETAGSDDYIRDMRLNEKLCALLTMIMEASWNPERGIRGKKRREIYQIRAWCDENYMNQATLDEIAGMFFIDKFYMLKMFKEQYGMTINAYITNKRITRAKQLLRFTDDSIAEIGARVGITDANYFNKLFKKVEGMTPGQFRKMW